METNDSSERKHSLRIPKPTWITFFEEKADTLLSTQQFSFVTSDNQTPSPSSASSRELVESQCRLAEKPPREIDTAEGKSLWVQRAKRINSYLDDNAKASQKD